jgi:hypothetical protein
MRASRQRNDTVIFPTPPTSNCGRCSTKKDPASVAGYDSDINFRSRFIRIFTGMIAASHQGNYATIANYLEKKLRYMDAGE